MSDDVSETVAHYPEACPCCRISLPPDLPAEEIGVHERVEVPEVKPVVVRHRRMVVRCRGCGARAAAPAAVGTPVGHRLRRSHAVMSAKADKRFRRSACRRRCTTCSGCASAKAG